MNLHSYARKVYNSHSLISAIQAARAHNSSDVTSQPAVNEVKETHSYCDAKPGQNITFVGEVLSLRIFLAKTIAVSSAACQKFLAANVSALSSFAQVLLDCASVFSIRRESLHLFYDQEGSTIAFNQNKALFFNYRYFENLHLPEAQQGKVAEAVVYWFVVMAHELASVPFFQLRSLLDSPFLLTNPRYRHNLITDHSADHSYYTWVPSPLLSVDNRDLEYIQRSTHCTILRQDRHEDRPFHGFRFDFAVTAGW